MSNKPTKCRELYINRKGMLKSVGIPDCLSDIIMEYTEFIICDKENAPGFCFMCKKSLCICVCDYGDKVKISTAFHMAYLNSICEENGMYKHFE